MSPGICSQRERIRPVYELDLLDLIEPQPEPHPALLAVMRPTARQVAEAASVMGWLARG